MPSQLPPAYDTANNLLAVSTAQLLTGVNGELGIITIRTPTTTLTIQLPKADVLAWAAMIRELGESMGGSGIQVVRGAVLRP